MAKRELMSGNEAVARGAFEAGLSFASAYPGTPSTEILENLAGYKGDVIAEWAPNEKVALEAAIGASIAGARSLSAMKMVGVNVAADPLFSFVYSGVNGGLVLISADDPGLHSSQNEQDNRFYAPFAKIPMFEPADSQEALDMVKAAFEVSEAYDTPVLFRMTTRVCHSKSLVETGARGPETLKPYKRDLAKYDLVPAVSRRLRANLDVRLARLAAYAETSPFNRVEDNGAAVGVVCSGVGYPYAREAFGDSASYLKLGFTFPLPEKLIADFAARVTTLYVVEELEPYLEDRLRQMGIACIGKAKLPSMYELTPGIVAAALTGATLPLIDVGATPPPRPPVLCAGCPHRGFFVELGRIAKRNGAIIAGDIGCYGLGGADPLNAKDFCICMGAAPSLAHGAQQVLAKFGKPTRVVATIGDSTFFHTGMTALLNTVYNGSNAITCILDNRITGMTGQQDNPGTGVTLQGKPTQEVSIEAVVRALGVTHVRVVDPNDLAATRAALQWAFGLDAPSVIITEWPCVLKKLDEAESDRFRRAAKTCRVETVLCDGCKVCLSVGCPALAFDTASETVAIDPAACTGCRVCAQVCSRDAIDSLELENA